MILIALKKYAPFYIALLVTALVMVFLFLRPGSALGLSVVVEQPQNERNQLSGFKLAEPVVIKAEVRFEGGTQVLTADSATLSITHVGDSSFVPVTSLKLPVEAVTGVDLSNQLPAGQGTLFVDVEFTAVKKIQVSAAAGGYGYGYDGIGVEGGVIKYTLTYTPPPLVGDYTATIKILTDQLVTAETKFSVLTGLDVVALGTKYPVSDEVSLPGDLVILQLELRETPIENINSVLVSGELVPEALSMVDASKFHLALREKWDVDTEAELLLPIIVSSDAVPGLFNFTVTAEDIAGQTFTTSSTTDPATSPIVEVASTRSTFNVYLMPEFSFIAPPLECTASQAHPDLCTGDRLHEFDIAELLDQNVPRSKLNPDFLAAIGSLQGDVPVSNIVDIVLAYNTAVTPPRFNSFTPSTVFADDLFTMRAGRGYVVKTRTVNGEEPFKTILDPTNPQFPSTEIPVPIKLAFTGEVIAERDQLLATTDVERRWNLVGAHTEIDTTVGRFLIPVTIPERTWVQLISFKNLLDISLDEAGELKLRAEGKPEILFQRRFESLRPPAGFPDSGPNPKPSGDPVPAGSALWLFMCETPVDTCVGGELLPVLE